MGRSEGGIRALYFPNRFPRVPLSPPDELVRTLKVELDEYFAGSRRNFDLPLDLEGTPFQLKVWGELAKIPYGETVTYGELAGRVGNPRAARAVGQAVGTNPVPIVIPCHRVLPKRGGIGNFGPGPEWKRRLLRLEGVSV